MSKKKDCLKCSADCCKDVSVHLNTPRTKKDWEEIRFLTAHKNIHVYKDNEGDWLVEFFTKCEKLKNEKCEIYPKRPFICRNHDADDCVKNGSGKYYKILFEKIEDVDNYLKEKEKKKAKKKKK